MDDQNRNLRSRFAVWTELDDEEDAAPESKRVNGGRAGHKSLHGSKPARHRESHKSSSTSSLESSNFQHHRQRVYLKKEHLRNQEDSSVKCKSNSNVKRTSHHKLSNLSNNLEKELVTCKSNSNAKRSAHDKLSNSSNNPDKNRIIKPMSYSRITELVEKEPNEIILTILNRRSGFDFYLRQSDVRRDIMAHILIALALACKSDLCSNVKKLITTVTSNETFFLISIPHYLAAFYKVSSKHMHLQSLLSLTLFLQKFQQSQPSCASESLLILLPLLKNICEKFLEGSEFYVQVAEKLAELEQENGCFLDKYTAEEIKQMSRNEKLQLQEPPESYREISVLPTEEDVLQPCTFLRPNLIKGKYSNVDHYLDVQFRLLREDYIKPLRDGVTEYLRLKNNKKSFKSCKDVRIYLDVHIKHQKFVAGGVVHIATFNVKDFPHVKWEFSKRFLTGSLLCLSSDDFKTMLFASVVQRNPEELKKGNLHLRFEEITDEILNLSPLTSFVVIETAAYFEAYRHNLSALLDLDETKLPLKRYIVDVEKPVLKPQYLLETTTYDMRPLLIPLNETNITHTLSDDGTTFTNYAFPRSISNEMKSVPVLINNAWPSSSELGLDSFQYEALKAAITKEFAIIQGPPGTGKTFIGLRIVQLLLHNADKWRKVSNERSPILIVCYTNHALDQFLEGLLLFTKKIVRIGGRGNNEALSKFQLNNLKMAARSKKEIPHYISVNIWQKFDELKALQYTIGIVKRSVERAATSVISELELKPYMLENHYYSLVTNRIAPENKFVTHEWLGASKSGIFDKHCTDKLGILEWEKIVSQYPVDTNVHLDNNPPAEYESESEDDIDFIEAQREINTEEFADVFDDGVGGDSLLVGNNSGWHVLGGRNVEQLYVQRCLDSIEAMDESDVKKVQDLWRLDIKGRWQIYKFWLQKYIEEKQIECIEKQRQLQGEYKELAEMHTEEDIYVLRNAKIVGMTTTGAAKYRDIVQRLNPQIVVIEEAAEILESHIVTSLAPNTQHVILIGDHQQLKPNPTVHLLAVKYDLNVSLFERMVNNGMDCYKLVEQHRMRPDIASLLVPHIYSNLKNHESVKLYENIKGISKNVFFVSHSYSELHELDSKSKVNEHEATFLVKLCKYLLLQGFDPSQITILTTYSGQYFVLKKLAAKTLIKNVRITIVDNFQGEENDIILISFVRSNEEGQIGFLKISNRVCVALSRAKKGLFCIGNFEMLAAKSKLWQQIAAILNEKQAIGPSLQLVCQNHPSVCNVVASEKDFDAVPEGGCIRPCEFRLSCGHTCPLICHPYDEAHEFVKCKKPCTKICQDCNKQCKKKCSMKCSPCINLVDKSLSLCGHTIQIHCYKRNEEIQCPKLCKRILACGHQCTNKCSESCVTKCVKKISVTSAVCGHEVSVKCFNSKDNEKLIEICRETCEVELACGHTCRGTCGECYQGRLHVACRQLCKRILVCGHECKSLCSKSCPPCKAPCENRCIHSVCRQKCGEPCKKCVEPCAWSCIHSKCTRLCGDPCNRLPCNEPCPELLKCGHPCIGFCGEPCLKECKECDRDKVTDIFLGSEDEPGARYIYLEDCNHLFEDNDFMRWMKTDTQGNGEIQMKTCPRCKTVIRRNLRYGDFVKSCLADIEKVKLITYGNKEKNFELQKALRAKIPNTIRVLSVLKPVWKALVAEKNRSIQEITTMENVVNVALELIEATTFISENAVIRGDHYFYSNCDIQIQNSIQQLIDYYSLSMKWLVMFIQTRYLNASEQQLQELSWEIHRLKLAVKLLKLIKNRTVKYPNVYFESMVRCLTKYVPFGNDDVQTFSVNFQSFVKQFGSAVINISEMEKQSILKAMGLARGHWYQCPNGHVYCITECGGAMQESRCNECNAPIGGSHHRLLSSNRVASDMDGSRHAAWSEAMNLENYRF